MFILNESVMPYFKPLTSEIAMSWIAVGFNGRVAVFSEKSGGKLLNVIEDAVKKLETLAEQNKEIEFFTARPGHAAELSKVRHFIEKNGLGEPKITEAQKDYL
jgi:hypothetical protein